MWIICSNIHSFHFYMINNLCSSCVNSSFDIFYFRCFVFLIKSVYIPRKTDEEKKNRYLKVLHSLLWYQYKKPNLRNISFQCLIKKISQCLCHNVPSFLFALLFWVRSLNFYFISHQQILRFRLKEIFLYFSFTTTGYWTYMLWLL